jgi:sugar-specific transcriptional regulator TrmB
MTPVWKDLLPYSASDFCAFENQVDAVIQDISITGKDLGFEDNDSPNVRECLDSHSQPLTDTDLIELEQRCAYDVKEEIATYGENCISKEISLKKLEQMFQNLENVKQQIMDLDPNVERSVLVC